MGQLYGAAAGKIIGAGVGKVDLTVCGLKLRGWGVWIFLWVFSWAREDIPIMQICGRRVGHKGARLRGGEVSDEADEFAAPVLEVAEHVVAGAGRAEQDNIAGGGDRVGCLYGVGEGVDELDFRGS